jgi:hypothetical protein
MGIETISMIITILLALGGYLITYQQNLRLTRRKERLELINKRLDEFYGPLYVSTRASRKTFLVYLQTVEEMKRQKSGESSDIPLSEVTLSNTSLSSSELWFTSEWRTWSTDIIYPILINCDNVILQKAYLIREEEMPECLHLFVAHMASLRRVIKKWEQGDFTEGGPLIKFPSELNEYAITSYQELKSEQLKLINELKLENS